MKKTTTFLSLLALGSVAFAQSPRMSLYEEFTGENCGPCAGTNPTLDPILAANANNTIVLKWQVAIPSAPSSMTSLYQQNKIEIDARDAYYSISSAPNGRQDGQSQTVFGSTSDHPGYITAARLNASAAITSPFTIVMTRAWDATFSNVTVTGTITASNTYTTTGSNLKFRLVMAEKQVNYSVAPGSNGETQFNHVARKSFPDLTNGTAMSASWTATQTQTFSIVCPLPSYIWDKSEVEMVGFIQDDANKKVLQASLAAVSPVTNDAAAKSISNLPSISCATSFTPNVTVKNNGSNAITSMTLNPYVNGILNGTPLNWTGSLAAGATTVIPMNGITGLTAGTKTFSVSISPTVNGSTDFNLGNNGTNKSFAIVGAYTAAPIAESFSVATFPPTNWLLVNPDGNPATWQRVTSVGSQSTTQSAKYPAYNASAGDVDDLILPPSSFVGFTAVKLTFDVASAPYSSVTPEDEKLEVMVSTNCGTSWTTVFTKTAAALNTAPFTTASFVPTASQWRSEMVDLSAYANNATVLVKFVGTSDYGNNIYIDQVNLNTGFTGLENKQGDLQEVTLFPNPASTNTSLNVILKNQSEVTLSVVNNVGQLVYQNVSYLQSGSNTLNIDTKQFATGMYNIVLATDNGTIVKKLSVVK